MKGKVIVVTGAAGLLGRAIALSVLEKGAEVIPLDVISPGGDLEEGFQEVDLTSIEALQAFIDKLPKVDGWVNAAYPRTSDWAKSVEDLDYASWQKNVEMQMNLVCEAIRLVGLKMRADKVKGSIVSLSSIYGMLAPQFDLYEGLDMTMPPAYAAIKAGIINYSSYMASFLGADGVRVNVVSPGGVYNEHSDEFVRRYAEKTMLKRMGKPEEIAQVVQFLLGNESSYITAQNVVVDGGWSRM